MPTGPMNFSGGSVPFNGARLAQTNGRKGNNAVLMANRVAVMKATKLVLNKPDTITTSVNNMLKNE